MISSLLFLYSGSLKLAWSASWIPSPSERTLLPIKSKSSILVGNQGTSGVTTSYYLLTIMFNSFKAFLTFSSDVLPSMSMKKSTSLQLFSINLDGIDYILVMLILFYVKIAKALFNTPGASGNVKHKLVLFYVSHWDNWLAKGASLPTCSCLSVCTNLLDGINKPPLDREKNLLSIIK